MTELFTVVDDGTNRPRWLAGRQGGVTATDISRLARGGAGTWAAVRAEKEGRGRDFKNAAMQHGIDREKVIAEYARASFGLVPSSALLAAIDEPRYLATPDGLSETETGEYKTTIHDWPTLLDAPARYLDQMLWQMRVTGRRKARLVFEPHDNGVPLYPFPRHFEFAYDESRVTELEAVAQEFLAGGEADENAAALDVLLSARVEAKETADAATAQVSLIDEQIRELLGGKPTKFEGSLANLTLSAPTTRSAFDSTAFKAAQPDVYQQFVKSSPVTPRLTITTRSN